MKRHLINPRKPFPMKSVMVFGKVLLLVMLIVSINFSTATATSKNSLSERIYLSVNNVTLKEALKEIERQTDYTFLYNDASIDVDQMVTFSAKELTVRELLDQILKNKGISYTIVGNQIVLTKTQHQQPAKRTIRGRITDPTTKQGLPGVTVVEKGTTNGTITDLNGNFTITVADDATIVISYVGYKKEEYAVKDRTDFNIQLTPDIVKLQDVVVIGYGTIKKSDVTGAVAAVSSEQLQQSAVSGLDQALQGRTAGVEVTSNSGSPGESPSVRIRGIGTVTNPDPFYVVDGVPVSAEEVGQLNPGDIQSTEILKDASAAAIYGARAANGVVLITTKKGKAGTSSVSFSSYVGMQSLAKKYDIMNQHDFITVRDSATGNTEDPSKLPSTDWQDQIFRKAAMSNYQLSFLGGSEKTQYALIGNYFNQKGILKGTDYDRYSFRLNTSSEVKPWLKVGENANYTISTRHMVPEQDEYTSVVVCALTMDPATPVYDSAGLPHAGIRNNIKNPVGTIERDLHTEKTSKLLDNLYVALTPVKWLTLRTSLGSDVTSLNHQDYLAAYQESTTYFQVLNQLLNGDFNFTSMIWENTATIKKTFAQKHQLQILAGYTRQYDKYRYQLSSSSGIPVQPNSRFISNTSDPTSIDYSDNSRKVGGVYFSNPFNKWDADNVPYDAYLISYLGRIIYDYADILDVNASVRRDGSSKFGKDTKWGIFPAFAAGLKLNKLFLQNSSSINLLKVRLGWGQLGNQEVGNYKAFTPVTTGLNYTTGAAGSQQTDPGSAPLSIGNNDLKWETTTMSNVGLDLNMLQNRLSFNVDYFIKKTTNMLVQVPVPGVTGVSQAPLVNKGSIQNKGLEINGVAKNKMGNFSYEVTGNISFIHNKVLELGSSDAYIQSGLFRASNYISRTAVGHPVGSFYGYVTDGYWQSQQEIDAANKAAQDASGNPRAVYDKKGTAPGDIKFKDLNGDHQITDADRTFIGNPTPTMTYGLNINLRYKIFDLTIFGQGVHGNKIFQSLIFYNESPNAYWNMDPKMKNYWTPNNPNAATPRLDPTNANDNLRLSDRYVKDGSYFRIQNLQLGVNLPSDICQKLKVKKFRIYLAAQNLKTFSKYSGFDPEIGTGNSDPIKGTNGVLDIGIDRGTYPVARSYSVGVNMTF